MSNPNDELSLPEEILLIALRDETGTPESRAGMIDFALGGAILAELALAGRVSIAPGKASRVDLITAEPLGNEILDECLEKIDRARKLHRAADWVSRFAQLKRLRVRLAQGLCRRGVLRDSEARVLLLFKRKAYPTIDPAPERRLVERMRRAIESEEDLQPRTATLLSLADATGMLRVHFDKTLLEARRQRLDRIAEGQAVGGAAREAVQAARAAVLAATTAASLAAISSTTH